MAHVVECGSLDVVGLASRLPCKSYVPTYSREIRHARRVEVRAMPLYGRYFFAWFKSSELRSVLRVRGVTGVLRSAGSIHPAIVDDAFVEGLRNTVIETDLELGDDVEIQHGSWKGFKGALSNVEDQRVKVMFSMLGRQCGFWIDKHEVSRIPDDKNRNGPLIKMTRL